MRTLSKGLVLLILTLVAGAAAARSSVPIVNLENNAITPRAGHTLSLEEVQHAIAAAGQRSGHWGVADSAPGKVRLNLLTRGHQAVVEVTFDTHQYSIRYVSSSNLNYEKTAKGELIHPKYNAWVQHLKNAIDQQLE